MIVVPTVPHTGTHFMRDHLLKDQETYVRHVYAHELDGLFELLEEGHPCIVPMRDRWQVVESWIRHGKDLRDFAGYSLPEWFNVQNGLVADFGPFYLEIDNPQIRSEQLHHINQALGLELTTDWPIIRQDDAKTL